jgi:hypothetical protein
MRRTVLWGDAKAASREKAPGIRKRPDCLARTHAAMKGGGLVPPPRAMPLPVPSSDTWQGGCAKPGGPWGGGGGSNGWSFHKLPEGGGGGVGEDFTAASAYVMVSPQTGERAGVLALRSLVESQLAVHSLLAQVLICRAYMSCLCVVLISPSLLRCLNVLLICRAYMSCLCVVLISPSLFSLRLLAWTLC